MSNEGMKKRYSSKCDAYFPDVPGFNGNVHVFMLHQKMGSHDVAELIYRTFDPALYPAMKTGVPVNISWKIDNLIGNFYGYISDIQYLHQHSEYREIKVTCIASSYPLKEKTSKIWVNKTIPEVITEIAKIAGLKAVVTPHPTKFSQISLAGVSLWQKIKELSERVGYNYQVIGTDLHFHPIDKMIDQFLTSIPIMKFGEQYAPLMHSDLEATLDQFEARIGDFVEKSENNRSEKVVSGVDPITGQIYTHTQSPSNSKKSLRVNSAQELFKEVSTDNVVNSKALAISLANAKASMSRLAIPAVGSGIGDPRISPYRTIEVRNTAPTTDGFWVIEAATHTVTWDGKYQVEFNCLSDSTGRNNTSATRPLAAVAIGVRDVMQELNGRIEKMSTPLLQSKLAMIRPVDSGYKVTPRRWVGK